jgi:hypothetical protein
MTIRLAHIGRKAGVAADKDLAAIAQALIVFLKLA